MAVTLYNVGGTLDLGNTNEQNAILIVQYILLIGAILGLVVFIVSLIQLIRYTFSVRHAQQAAASEAGDVIHLSSKRTFWKRLCLLSVGIFGVCIIIYSFLTFQAY